jgi:alpha-L-rhamnosidase
MVVNDDLAITGYFETSDQTINQVYANAVRGIRGNYKGMPVDCPQRNERQPWLGDRGIGSLGESYIYGTSCLYAKWLDDIRYSQKSDGALPDVAPAFWRYYSDNMTWPGTYILIADMLYNQFGDIRPVEKHYESMKKWLEYMRDRYLQDNIIVRDRYGDWCVPPESQELIHARDPNRITDGKLIGTAYYYHLLQLMKKFAQLQGFTGDYEEFHALGLKIRDAFNNEFLDQEGFYGNNTVTANLLPLYFGMVPGDYEELVFKHITDKIIEENDGHISTGLIGTQWLMRGLTRLGRPDIALQLATNRGYPSWGYMVEQGASTIWELWNGDTADPGMNSHNHVMLLGDLVAWFYEDLAGIRPDPRFPGFKRIIMDPAFPDGLDFVDASYKSVHGLIISKWGIENGRLTWDITIPPNTTAEVNIPADSILESGEPVKKGMGIKSIHKGKGHTIIEIGSGSYRFETTVISGNN